MTFNSPPPASAYYFRCREQFSHGEHEQLDQLDSHGGSGTNRFLEVCTQARDSVAGDVPVLTVTATD